MIGQVSGDPASPSWWRGRAPCCGRGTGGRGWAWWRRSRGHASLSAWPVGPALTPECRASRHHWCRQARREVTLRWSPGNWQTGWHRRPGAPTGGGSSAGGGGGGAGARRHLSSPPSGVEQLQHTLTGPAYTRQGPGSLFVWTGIHRFLEANQYLLTTDVQYILYYK